MGVTLEGERGARSSAAALGGRRNVGAAAWLALMPTALLTLALVVVLGPPAGHLLFAPAPSLDFWPGTSLRPEPVEQGRYVLLIACALAFAPAIVAADRLQRRCAPAAVRAGVALAQLATFAFLVACWIGQQRPAFQTRYFTDATLIVAALLTSLVALAASLERTRSAARRLLRETRPRRAAAQLAAVVVTALWLLHAINSDQSIAWANSITRYHVQFPFDEAFAVVNGLTPLVDFTPQYASLWPYLAAAAMGVFGKTLLVFAITMCALTTLAMAGVFDVLRRAAASAVAALLLYLPFMATSFFFVWSDSPDKLLNRHTFGSYFAAHPLRYAGPFLLAWLTARGLDRAGSRTWPLFAAGALVAINNSDFGLAALAATGAALLWTLPDRRPRALGRLAASAAAGIALAVLLVSALTLARAGELPQFTRGVAFAHVYLVGGFNLMPLPGVLGLHLIFYATYVAAIGVATVRVLARAPNRVLTGMLAWSGLFGLVSAAYYVGRSAGDTLPMTFSAWTFALALLTIAAVRQLAALPRAPRPAALVVVFAMAVAACSLAQAPVPWAQLDRIRHAPQGTPGVEGVGPLMPSEDPDTRFFLASIADGPHRFVTRPGAPVALFTTMGHRIADAYGVRDVVPVTGIESIQTRSELDEALDALRAAGGNTAILPQEPPPAVGRALRARGFALLTEHGLRAWKPGAGLAALSDAGGMTKWVDTRHLHPAALAGR